MARTFDELPARAQSALLRILKVPRSSITPARVAEISIDELRGQPNCGTGTIRSIATWLLEHDLRPAWSDVQPLEPVDDAADALKLAAKKVTAAGLPDRAAEVLAIARSILEPDERERARQTIARTRLEALASREALAAARQAAEAAERERIATVVRMKDEEGKTFRQIGAELGIGATTARETYHKAARLRDGGRT